jgi:predicted negative regulator of RcsB-dependent stress response
MHRMRNLLCAVLVLALAGLVHGEAQGDPAELFAQGEAKLAQGDFEAAVEQFAAAAQAAPDNEQYKAEYTLLRRVMMVRPMLEKQNDPAQWERLARALRAYYYDHGVFTEALKLDRTRYEREVTAESAAMLAETQLELKRNVAALETLDAVETDAVSPRVLRMKGIALAREKSLDEARAQLKECAKVEEKDAQGHLELARLYALLGDEKASTAELAFAMQWTPPSQLAALRETVKKHPDFSGLVAAESFTVALATESKVKESSCSGGTSCGSCPSRSTCGEQH